MQEQPVDLIITKEDPSIFWQDEILQVIYWMRGEGFGEKASIPDLQRFLDASDEILAANLTQLGKNGLVELDETGKYELTASGVTEGGRRFADEFDGMLKQGHYECDDPDCDCHSPDAVPCRAVHTHQH
jgi:hypothetical protein